MKLQPIITYIYSHYAFDVIDMSTLYDQNDKFSLEGKF